MAEGPHTSAISTAADHISTAADHITAIVGTGLVGSGWAVVFARAGHTVRVFDPKPEIRERLLSWTRRSVTALEWIAQDVPDMRIIDQNLWDRVKARQAAVALGKQEKPAEGFWDRRRPRYFCPA